MIPLGNNLPSGPNQHYLPVFLQKPFGMLPKRKEIWVFARDVPVEKDRIKKVGASDNFYSYPSATGERTLDDDITNIEVGISEKLNMIRAKSVGSKIDASSAAEVIDHLVPRTAHVRLNLERGLRMMADGVASVLRDEERIQSLLGLDQDEPNEAFKNALASKLQELGYMERLGIPNGVIERVAFFQAKENFASIAADTLPSLRAMLNSWLQTSDGIVRDLHNNILRPISNSAPRLSLLKELNWSIQSAQHEGAILPDCVAIALEEIGEPAPAMFADWKNIVAIMLPVAPDKLLVGSSVEFDIKKFPDFNSAAARCSHDFFLAPKTDEYLIGLQDLLGQRSTQLVEDGISGAFAPYLASKPKPRDKNSPLFPVDLLASSREQWSYELSLLECGDVADSQALSNTVTRMVSVLADVLPLQRLDGITIASNYLGAVTALDRGYKSASAIKSAPKEIGRGVARTVSVKREGRWKERIVVDADVAFALFADDETTVAWASYVVTRQLTEVAIPEIIERSLPGVLMSPIKDEFHNFLYPNVHPAIFSYITSHICAGFGDTLQQSNIKRELLVGALRELKSAVLPARLKYRHHGKLDILLGVTMPCISYVLQFAADLLGHCAASGEQPFDIGGELSATLADTGLDNWFPMFGDHLERLRLRFGQWESFDEFLVLGSHVERLLWQMGMIPWIGPEGLRIEVPLGTDTDELIKNTQN